MYGAHAASATSQESFGSNLTTKIMKHVTKLVKCNLQGKNGNALNLIAVWQTAAKKQGTPKEEIEAVVKDALSSDYDHVLQVLISNIA